MTFNMDDTETILPPDNNEQSRLEYHDKIIMGGTIGGNIRVEP